MLALQSAGGQVTRFFVVETLVSVQSHSIKGILVNVSKYTWCGY